LKQNRIKDIFFCEKCRGWRKFMLEIGSIVWGVKDINRAVAFWSAALDYQLKYPAEEDWAILVPKSGHGIQLSLKLIASDKAQRHHMDLFTDHQKEEVERLLTLGASRKEWNYEEGADYVVLNDPDGNPFCVVQR
jgi:catechol 2,3-dioxygenase-like lactoylglutathione lyase family enzyme